MTLLTAHIEAGWREVESGTFGKWVAERVHARPGATSSVIRVEAETSPALQRAVTLRESQLVGTEEPIKDTVTSDGTLVTGEQHEALRTDGVIVPDQAATNEAAAAKDAEIESLRTQLAEAQATADPSPAPVTEQPTADSSPSSEPTSNTGDPSPEQTSTDSPASPAEGEQPPASE